MVETSIFPRVKLSFKPSSPTTWLQVQLLCGVWGLTRGRVSSQNRQNITSRVVYQTLSDSYTAEFFKFILIAYSELRDALIRGLTSNVFQQVNNTSRFCLTDPICMISPLSYLLTQLWPSPKVVHEFAPSLNSHYLHRALDHLILHHINLRCYQRLESKFADYQSRFPCSLRYLVSK